MLYPETPYDPARHRIVLVHIRKTAGTSLGRMLSAAFGEPLMELIEEGTHARADRGLLRLHRRVRHGVLAAQRRAAIAVAQRLGRPAWRAAEAPYIAGHFLLGQEPPGDRAPLYVTLVRDPVDRLVSDYWFMRRKRDRSRGDAVDPALYDLDLPAFADAILADPGLYRDNLQTRTLAGAVDRAAMAEAVDRRLWLAAATDQFPALARRLGEAIGRDLGAPLSAKRNAARPAEAGLDPGRVEALAALNALDMELVGRIRTGFADLDAALAPGG